jgi:myo-inositol-1(or 4)-monophosphatase
VDDEGRNTADETVTADAMAERYEAGRKVALRAGALAAEYASRLSELDVRFKGAQDVVTEADLEVELLIKRGLADFAGDGFLGEETGAAGLADSPGIWVVDPIDGTQPFVSEMPSWCVSIGYVHRGELQFGFVHNPPQDELFEGGLGRPALLNGRPVAPHPGQTLADGVVSVGYSSRIGPDDLLPVLDRLLRQGGMFYRNGSAALSLCYVASGRLLGYIEPHINSWDCLGALAVIRSAGGRTNDYLTGDALTAGNRIVAGPPAVYDALEAVLGS